MYDEYGLPKDDGFDYKQFIATDDIRPGDMYIPAPPEMLEAMLTMKGRRRDVDKEFKDMTEEGNYTFGTYCLQQKRQYTTVWKMMMDSTMNLKMISYSLQMKANLL